MNLVKRMQAGATVKSLEKEMLEHDKKVAKETGRKFGECESCGQKTVLVDKVDLCGPCCFGEADTANGNF